MLYDIFEAVKTKLMADVAGLQGVEWYNVQYEANIASTPRIFVEFPDLLAFEQINKQTRRTPLKIRLHIVTQALAEADGAIPDSIAQNHETTALAAKDSIDKFTPVNGESKLTTPMQFSGWQHFHKHKGWMITFVEFDGKKVA